ncbi:PQQ-binding-like beta-propeller repeat protein [Streptomyces sp. YGL11-2]|uniref:serine/threonine-protein kinase n=1 Tax=Streptomyces sp. YGL11-2 TaxID=3414028 RepID=UPI003CF5AE60
MAVRVLGDRYELVSFVGRGGMGEVWEGRDRVIRRRVAVKLLPYRRGGELSAELFFREARTAGGLSHRGVVTVHDMGQDPGDGTLFLVMEFVAGRDLAAVLRADGPPAVPVAVDWGVQGAAALAAAHDAGIVHRDLKPANLMLTSGGDIKILDFGIARFMAATDKSSKVMGTLAYMAPERFREHSGDARTDLYAFGCVLYELLTGDTPFRAADPVSMMTAHLQQTPTPPGELRPGVPAALDALVMRLLAKDPADRPASAADVRDALRAPGIASGADPAPPPAAEAPGIEPARDTPPLHTPPPAERTATERTPTEGTPSERTPGGPAADAGPGPFVDRHHLPTQTAPSPEPVHRPAAGGEAAPDPLLGRRRALRLGLGAVVTAGVTGLALFPWGDGQDAGSAAGGTGPGADAPSGTSAHGAQPWHYYASTLVPRGPAFSGGVLYFADGAWIYGVDALTGEKRSSATADGTELPNGFLAAAGGMLFVGGAKGKLYAVKSTGGSVVWTFTAGNGIGCAPTVAGRLVLVGSLDKSLHALDAATGTEKWSFATGDFVLSPAAVAHGTVFVGSDDRTFYAVDAATGARKWAFQAVNTFRATAAVDRGLVYVPNNDQTLYALDAATGSKRWAVPLGGGTKADDNDHPSCPVVADGTVYVGGRDNLLHALDATTGRTKWTYGISGDFRPTTPAVADGTVYVGDRAEPYGTLHAVDASTGRKRWTFRTGSAVGDTGAPVVANGRVYVANRDGLYAVVAATGQGRN